KKIEETIPEEPSWFYCEPSEFYTEKFTIDDTVVFTNFCQDKLSVEERIEKAKEFNQYDKHEGDQYKELNWKYVVVEDGVVLIVAEKNKKNTLKVRKKSAKNINYTQIDYSNKKLKQKIKQKKFEPGFLGALENMCGELDMHCMGLLSVMDFETGGTFRSDIKNKYSGAVGLIQFVGKTARHLGTTKKDLAQMSQVEQLTYVKKYFNQFKKRADYSQPEDIGLAIFYPRALGKGADYVIAKKGSRTYRQNAKLDKNDDGRIASAEYVRPALNRKLVYDL
ncbi:hypothetical protein HON01_05145, partial [Candidatus Woesearchaeota archaeon]|nr:hypothetical protein [Candidatus Woesearchaeota archaeon]